jgi:hypothetical protein
MCLFGTLAMLSNFRHNPTPYDDDLEDQPGQSAYHKWGLGILVPALLLSYSIWILLTDAAEFGSRFTMPLRGENAMAYGLAVMSVGVFMHCHYFWGNIYNQIWLAVLGKIVSLCGFIAATVFLCIRIGILGRS